MYTGERRGKDDALFDAMGTVDELSSMLGLAREYTIETQLAGPIVKHLESIQCALQDVNSNVATPRDSAAAEYKIQKTRFDPDDARTQQVEQWIDELDA